ncbi:MAG: C40 family peptidase [Clostridia bacterium]|nr:C40 family peptidase [Clostridia bacterium]
MKKLIALILALILAAGALSACGEKAPVGGGDTAQTDDGAQEINAPAPAGDDEETDKEATETVSATGEVSLPPTAPDTAPATQTNPGGDTQTKPGDNTQPPAQTAAPSSEKPASSNGNRKGLVPASGKVEFTKDFKEEYNILFFSDGFTIAYNMGDVMMKLAEADGIKLDFTTAYYDNIGTESTYNFYEAFSFKTEGENYSVESVKNSVFSNPINDPSHYKYDFFIPLVSRDRGISQDANKARTVAGIEYYTKALSEAQPGVQTVLFAPSGYKEGNDGALIKKIGLKQTTLKEHNAAIHEFTDLLLSKTSGKKSAVYICDAFDYFNDNYSSLGIDLYDGKRIYPSMAGAYYTACVTYSSLFGNATSGIPFYGFIEDENAAKALQKAADEYVSSTGKSLKAHTETHAFQPLTLEQADPRNLPIRPEFAHEVYPEYYDVLLSAAMAYYQRTWFIQYDNNNMDRVNRSFYRREVTTNLSPEEATPQNFMYSDCSAFLYELFVDAFNCDLYGANGVTAMFQNSALNKTAWRVADYDEALDKRSPEELKAYFYSVLQPGDIIGELIPGEGMGGHVMLYIGNGKMIHFTGRHATGGGENYLWNNGTDEYEMVNSILYDPVEPAGWYQQFGKKDYKLAIFRPGVLGLKPTKQAENRLNGLRNVVAYKRTTAPEGVTVSPGGDVTFTFVIKNVDFTPKTINITDKLPQGVSFKSGNDFKLSGSDLAATVTVSPGKTLEVSYTVTVDKNALPGTAIECHSAYLNGVLHNDTSINVAKTLNASQQAAFAAAADKVGDSASDGFDLAAKVYKEAFNYTLPYSSASDAFAKVFKGSAVSALLASPQSLAVLDLFGGKSYTTYGPYETIQRIRRFSTENLVAGDIVFYFNDTKGESSSVYVYSGDGILAAVADGKYIKYSAADSQMIAERALSYPVFCVLRPSFGM